MHPDHLVAMDQLLRRAGTTIEDMSDVELIRRAAREQDRVADGSVHRMSEDLGREHPRPAGDAGDIACLRAEEPLDDVVEEGAVLRRDGGLDERVQLAVEASQQVGVEEVLDDDGAIPLSASTRARVGASAGSRWRSMPPTLGRDRGRYPEQADHGADRFRHRSRVPDVRPELLRLAKRGKNHNCQPAVRSRCLVLGR